MKILDRVKNGLKGFRNGWSDDSIATENPNELSSDFVDHLQRINRRLDVIEKRHAPVKVDEDLSKEEKLERAIENVSKTSIPDDYFTNRKYPGLAQIESKNLIHRYTVENRQIVIRFQSGQELIITAPNRESLGQLRITAENLETDLKPAHATADPTNGSADLNDIQS